MFDDFYFMLHIIDFFKYYWYKYVMTFENPLDKIRKMKAEKTAEKKEFKELEKEQEVQSQENINTQYELVNEQRQGYSEQINDLKERISEITGTQSEMIAQYRQTINEVLVAKENETDEEKDARLETLEYIRKNFNEIFGVGKKQWREVGSEKLKAIDSQKSFNESVTKLDSQLEELYPKTTIGKESIKEEEQEALQKELADIELTDTIKNKWELLQESRWQEDNLEKFKLEKEGIIDDYTMMVKEYNALIGSGDYVLPEFDALRLSRFDKDYSNVDFKEGLDALSQGYHAEILAINQDISKVKSTIFKKGLKKLEAKKKSLEVKEENRREAYNKLYSIKTSLEEKITSLHNQNDVKELYRVTNRVGNATTGLMFREIERDRLLNQEQKDLLSRHSQLQEKLQTL